MFTRLLFKISDNSSLFIKYRLLRVVMNNNLNELQKLLGYEYKNTELLNQALTHSSYANEHQLGKNGSNERLEFLGDAVLELVSSEFFYGVYPDKPEGELTKIRASFVCEPALVACAKNVRLSEFIKLGKGEEHTGGRFRPSIISDTFEAVIGSIYLDGGFANAKEVILKFILNGYENKVFFYDSKTILQEVIQSQDSRPVEYDLLSEEGPDHLKKFIVAVKINGERVGVGEGVSKKSAEQAAAYEALKKLGKV